MDHIADYAGGTWAIRDERGYVGNERSVDGLTIGRLRPKPGVGLVDGARGNVLHSNISHQSAATIATSVYPGTGNSEKL